MTVTLGTRPEQGCDTILRFLPAGGPICFQAPELQEAYAACLTGDPLTLSHKEIRSLRLPFRGGFVTVLLAGFDSGVSQPFDDLRKVTAKLGAALVDCGGQQAYLDGTEALTFASEREIVGQIAAVLPLCTYRFDRYHTETSPVSLRAVTIGAALEAADALEEGTVLARSVMIARDLVNELARVLTPEELARRCLELGAEFGFEVEVLDRKACEELGMGLFLAVSAGSALEPRFIVLRWRGGGGEPPIALVGKGITYDTGGLAIKTSSMDSMRFDMNGAAAVIGAMCAIAARKLPCNVTAAVAACENAVGPESYRNGDVYPSMNGKTVFVRNTDAEGRLSMADAITYCVRREKPSQLIEVAGLTGSVCNFYGKVCAAALTTHQVMFDRLAALMPVTGEKYAQMPAFPEYRELLKTPYADLNNAPADGPGGILAGLFLAEFHEDVPFLHVDFGAMPFTSAPSDGQPAGGTGFGVRTLYHYVKSQNDGGLS